MSEQQYGALADKIATKYGIPPDLFRKLISAESGWNPNAVSSAGARGLTQVVPKWHPDANLSTPAGQLDAGARYLKSGLKKYGNPRDALSQYNSGRPWSQGQKIPETRNYVTKILGGYSPGTSPAPGASAAPPTAIPGAGDVQQIAPNIDAKRLMMLLDNQRARSLRGLMPAPGFQRELQKVVTASLPRAQVAGAGATVGKAVPILPGAPAWGSYGYADPEGQGGRHLAVDWFAKHGTPVAAPVSGKVVRISPSRGNSGQVFGGVLAIRDAQGRLIVMRHIDPANFKVGQTVRAGQVVGTPTNWIGGSSHIHLETYRAGSSDREYSPKYAINPKEIFG